MNKDKLIAALEPLARFCEACFQDEPDNQIILAYKGETPQKDIDINLGQLREIIKQYNSVIMPIKQKRII